MQVVKPGPWVAPAVFSVCVGSCLASFACLFPYAHPLWDDFHRCAKLLSTGILRNVAIEYLGNGGRWAATLFHYLIFTSIDPTEHYGIVLSANFVVFLVAVFRFISALYGADVPPRCRWGIAAGLSALYWNNHPSTGQSLYWLTGSVEYTLSLGLLLWLFASLMSRDLSTPRSKVVLGGFLVLCSGLHELHGLVAAIALAAITLGLWRVKHPAWRDWRLASLIMGAGMLINLLAPGNFKRMAYYAGAIDLRLAIELTLTQFGRNVGRWCLDFKHWLAVPLILVVPTPKVSNAPPELLAFFRRSAPLLILGLLLIGFLLPSTATGIVMEPRVLGSVYFIFLLGALLLLMLYRDAILARIPVGGRRWLQAPFLAAFGVSLVLVGNVRTALVDLFGPAPAYSRMMEARYRQARAEENAGRADLLFPKIADFPRSYYGEADLLADPSANRNVSFAKFMAVRSAQVE
jgi:hypothetical protein